MRNQIARLKELLRGTNAEQDTAPYDIKGVLEKPAAGASVNHFHFQGFIRQQPFPIEKNHWRHNGGADKYPLQVERFEDAESSWAYIDQLTGHDRAFNCLYRNNYCYVVPRKYQGTVELPDWLTGAGWIDMAGAITVADEYTFNAVDERAVSNALALLSEEK